MRFGTINKRMKAKFREKSDSDWKYFFVNQNDLHVCVQ
jgi:hypothetical protein